MDNTDSACVATEYLLSWHVLKQMRMASLNLLARVNFQICLFGLSDASSRSTTGITVQSRKPVHPRNSIPLHLVLQIELWKDSLTLNNRRSVSLNEYVQLLTARPLCGSRSWKGKRKQRPGERSRLVPLSWPAVWHHESKYWTMFLDMIFVIIITQIRRSYRALSARHHPDKGGDGDAFKALSLAYSVLSDPVKVRGERI